MLFGFWQLKTTVLILLLASCLGQELLRVCDRDYCYERSIEKRVTNINHLRGRNNGETHYDDTKRNNAFRQENDEKIDKIITSNNRNRIGQKDFDSYRLISRKEFREIRREIVKQEPFHWETTNRVSKERLGETLNSDRSREWVSERNRELVERIPEYRSEVLKRLNEHENHRDIDGILDENLESHRSNNLLSERDKENRNKIHDEQEIQCDNSRLIDENNKSRRFNQRLSEGQKRRFEVLRQLHERENKRNRLINENRESRRLSQRNQDLRNQINENQKTGDERFETLHRFDERKRNYENRESLSSNKRTLNKIEERENKNLRYGNKPERDVQIGALDTSKRLEENLKSQRSVERLFERNRILVHRYDETIRHRKNSHEALRRLEEHEDYRDINRRFDETYESQQSNNYLSKKEHVLVQRRNENIRDQEDQRDTVERLDKREYRRDISNRRFDESPKPRNLNEQEVEREHKTVQYHNENNIDNDKRDRLSEQHSAKNSLESKDRRETSSRSDKSEGHRDISRRVDKSRESRWSSQFLEKEQSRDENTRVRNDRIDTNRDSRYSNKLFSEREKEILQQHNENQYDDRVGDSSKYRRYSERYNEKMRKTLQYININKQEHDARHEISSNLNQRENKNDINRDFDQSHKSRLSNGQLSKVESVSDQHYDDREIGQLGNRLLDERDDQREGELDDSRGLDENHDYQHFSEYISKSNRLSQIERILAHRRDENIREHEDHREIYNPLDKREMQRDTDRYFDENRNSQQFIIYAQRRDENIKDHEESRQTQRFNQVPSKQIQNENEQMQKRGDQFETLRRLNNRDINRHLDENLEIHRSNKHFVRRTGEQETIQRVDENQRDRKYSKAAFSFRQLDERQDNKLVRHRDENQRFETRINYIVEKYPEENIVFLKKGYMALGQGVLLAYVIMKTLDGKNNLKYQISQGLRKTAAMMGF